MATEAQKARRKRARENQKARRKETVQQRLERELDPALRPTEETKISLEIIDVAAKPPEPNISNSDILAAIQGIAGAVQDLAQNTAIQFQEMHNRIATVEEAQSQGLLTLASESVIQGIGQFGEGPIPGAIPQSQLVKSRHFQDLKVDEHRILSEPGLDLPQPNDDHIVIVGTITEAEKLRRQEMLHGAQGGY